jgi:ABC-type sulfate transport system substrate-binding protein
MRVRSHFVRRTAAAVAGIALAVTAAGALQASATPDTIRTTSTAVARAVAAAPKISVGADKTRVKAGAKITLTGTTTGIPANTKVTVQDLQNGRWVNLATTNVTRKATYSVSVTSHRIGVNTFRAVTTRAVSGSVKVTVVK